MRTMTKWLGAAALAITSATAAQADDGMVRTADHNGAMELSNGNYAKAGRVLAAAQRVSPQAPDVLLNLAQLNLRNGSLDVARDFYRQVLAAPDDQMLLTGGRWESAHTLARTGLREASGSQFVAR